LQNGILQAVVRLDGAASVCEFDSYKLHHNFGDTLTRQAEHYHRKVHAEPDHAHGGDGIANPHERMGSKHEITQTDMVVDSYRKTLFNDFWVNENGTGQALNYRRPTSSKTVLDFCSITNGGKVHKKISLEGNSLVVGYQFLKLPGGDFKVEINLAMPSCDGPAGRFRYGKNIVGGFGQVVKLASLKHIALEDEVLGGIVHLYSNKACNFCSYPHFSVSQSEAGFEKIMQAVTLELRWPERALKDGLEIKLEVM
jgi:hypothetical protein